MNNYLGSEEHIKNAQNAQKIATAVSAKMAKEKQAKLEEGYYKSPKFCKNCGNVIEFKRKENQFCSKSCSASYNNQKRKHSLETREKISNTLRSKFGSTSHINRSKFGSPQRIENTVISKLCLHCGKEIPHRNTYCSRSCQTNYNRSKYIKRWKDGKECGYVGKWVHLNQHLRRYIFDKFDNKCCKCGVSIINPHSGLSTLTINHIDGKAKNNKEDNLELLCPNCHSMTHNYGSLNKDSDRIYKRHTFQPETMVVPI
jgi:predicted nucleic acid-binding Zn ribbon protein